MAPLLPIHARYQQKILSFFISSICIFNFSFFINAQSGSNENAVFQSLTINDGLSQGMVNKILQDRYGFMWFATKDGLNQYDGYHFKIYRHDADDTSSLADSYVETLLEDSKGRIWAGTSSGYLDLFHQSTGTFEHIKMQANQTEPLAPGPLYQILEDNERNIWVLFSGKAFIIHLQDGAHAESPLYSIKQLPLPVNSTEPFLFISKRGAVYFTDRVHSGVYMLDKQSNEWLGLTNINDFLAKMQPGNPEIYNIIEDTVTGKLYAVYTNGIMRFDSTSSPEQILTRRMPYTCLQSLWENNRILWFVDSVSIGKFNVENGQLSFLIAKDDINKTKT